MKCYLCSSPTRMYLHKNGFDLYKCVSCGLIRTDLKEKYETFVEKHYSRGYFTGDATRSAYADYGKDKAYITKNLNKFLRFIRERKTRGTFLDVGCAYGYAVESALAYGFDAYGFDASLHAVEEAKTLVGSKRIQQGLISNVSYGQQKFDVVSLFDVFEHLADPVRDIKRLAGFLSPDGVMMIATGDVKSVAARIFGRRWTFFIPPQHLFFFDHKTMTTALEKAGLKPVKWYRIGKWLSLGYVLHLGRTTGESKVASLFYRLIGNTLLARLPVYIPMMDNMIVLAERAHT